MKEITKNPEFDYILLCNKICGAAHYNMQMNIIVETQEEYDKWLAEQKSFKSAEAPVVVIDTTGEEDSAEGEEATEEEVETTEI